MLGLVQILRLLTFAVNREVDSVHWGVALCGPPVGLNNYELCSDWDQKTGLPRWLSWCGRARSPRGVFLW